MTAMTARRDDLDLGRCTCPRRWRLYLGVWDRHGYTVRCYGCRRIPAECLCRR